MTRASAGIVDDFRRYASTFVRVLGWKVALALVLMTGLGLTEGLGFLLLIPLLNLVGLEVGQGGVGQFSVLVSRALEWVGAQSSLPAVLVVFTIIMSTQALLFRWQTIINRKLEYDFAVHLRQRLYRAIVGSEWTFFVNRRSSEFAHVLTAEIDRVGLATQYLLSLIATTIVVLVYLLLALRLSATMTMVVLGCAGVLTLALKDRINAARSTGEGLSHATGAMYAAVVEHLIAMKTIKGYGTEQRNVSIFSDLTRDVADRYLTAVGNYAGVKAWFDIGSVVILSAILFLSFQKLAISTAGVLLLIFVFARVMPRLSSIQQSYHHFINALPAFGSVVEMQALADAAIERPHSAAVRALERSGAPAIHFDRVSFAYPRRPSNGPEGPKTADAGTVGRSTEHPDLSGVLREVSLTIAAGRTSALVGPSGAGKSTVADLALGLLRPTAGRILIDDAPLSEDQHGAWRARIGYVAQDTFLFHDTIRANLLWARPDAKEQDIRRALEAAAAQFIADLPHGLETVLGDRGLRLSGGERQRLAFARALLRQPSFLILDEATSNVDAENEARILRAIEALHGRMTILMITHRLATVREADQIYVMEQGRIVESGSWPGLMERERGRFRALWEAQSVVGQARL
ncbi:MAG: ABC transporter ATP-binding protein [Acidobacteria bacterium]|nr:ABC transporter ATP-binding protein [Acidobacteriota bacterium]